jgi:hypothetical protein
VPEIFIKSQIFLSEDKYVSIFIITESVVALYVRKIPIGNKIYEDAHIPENVPTTSSSTSFCPDIDIT